MKYVLIAFALVAAAAGAFGRIEQLRAQAADTKAAQAAEHVKIAEKALNEANRQITLQQGVNLQRQQDINQLRAQASVQQKALDDALQAHPDWARAPVPDRVWDALGAPAAAAGQAGPGVDGADAKAAAHRPR